MATKTIQDYELAEIRASSEPFTSPQPMCFNGPICLRGYLVAALPDGNAVIGSRAYVTDAFKPKALEAVVGGGAIVMPVFYTGTTWIVC